MNESKSSDHHLIEIKNLSLQIGSARILNAISFKIGTQEIVSLVGESGSGKSITALSLLGLHPKKSIIEVEKMLFDGIDIRQYTPKDWQHIRGNKIGMIFQEPQSSLNPSMRCGKQLQEVLQQHRFISEKEQKALIIEMLKEVQLNDPERLLKS